MAVLSFPEYGRIVASSGSSAHREEDYVALHKKDFASLKEWCRKWVPPSAPQNDSNFPDNDEKKPPFQLVYWKHRECLQAKNYVGVVLLPSGDSLEILPKITKKFHDEGIKRSRNIMLRMLRMITKTEYRQFEDTALSKGRMPLLEIFIHCFLNEVGLLIRRGIRSDYTPVEDNITCLRGRLLMPQHIRCNIVHREKFYVQYDEYLPNRPENRLIKTALQRVRTISRDNENMRRCAICLDAFGEIPTSTNFRADFAVLRQDRNVSHYRASLFWSRLLLQEDTPVPASGKLRCTAILLPMEKLFEEYVAQIILRKLQPQGWVVTKQAASEHLVEEHNGKKYLLKPDFLLEKGKTRIIADAKWKNIDSNDAKSVSQSDLYQLFTYSEKYLRKFGCEPQRSFLVYPKTDSFDSALAEFQFYANTAILKAVPFDLESDSCDLFTDLIA